MIDESFRVLRLPAGLEDAGFAYGRECRELLTDRLAPYLADMRSINRVDADSMARQADLWFGRLPDRYQAQIEAMGVGAGVTTRTVAEFLYADIAAPAAIGMSDTTSLGDPRHDEACDSGVGFGGPMCSGLVIRRGGEDWVGRNCDWYWPTLRRGTAAVVHRVPGRIPCMTLGIMGDLDADTGINAERLWLHMHTLRAMDEPRAGVSCISWLFWMREALETCANLAEVEDLLCRTDRDRGVMLLAVDGKSRGEGGAAVYECARSTFRRIDPDATARGPVLIATNHCKHQHVARPTRRYRHDGDSGDGVRHGGRSTGTIARRQRLEELVREAFPEEMPHDLCEILADRYVEMRGTSHLRTIYSAVVCPAREEIHFAAGTNASTSASGHWRSIVPEW